MDGNVIALRKPIFSTTVEYGGAIAEEEMSNVSAQFFIHWLGTNNVTNWEIFVEENQG